MEVLVDFDGTLTTHDYPKIGKDIGAIKVLKRLIECGHKIILFTMRSHQSLNEAVNFLKDNGIELYGININPTQHYWTSSPKPYGQLIIDDISLGIPLIYNETEEDALYNEQVYHHRPYVDWIKVEQLLIDSKILW